ncbi:putative transporter small subunit [Alcaligenes endophyticus]|uniref:Transporter small subunit n=1 Tax=Alcaligenes endophyticus TaxID=1929088 RepID=A0ABT8EGL7_9BURK|nr:putative transporter small subunit [Alcaligenes endophyticus]MCX5590047.1 putative transporter small subunit [Alcaligenes endophyticus]MDN4120290.1 putative transporter small subunit [Alcaligenes endophyticus]
MMLTVYFLVWPVISAGILLMLIVSLVRDISDARKTGKKML